MKGQRDNLASQNVYILKVIPSLTLISKLEVDFPGNKSRLGGWVSSIFVLDGLGEGRGSWNDVAYHRHQLQDLVSLSLL